MNRASPPEEATLLSAAGTLCRLGRQVRTVNEEETRLLYVICPHTDEERQQLAACTSPTDMFNISQTWPPQLFKHRFMSKQLNQGMLLFSQLCLFLFHIL